MRSYEAARGSFSMFELLARIVICVGVLAAIAGGVLGVEMAGRGTPVGLMVLLAALPGAVIALFGLSSLATAQMGRASVDSAEYAQQALQISREQLELSRQAQVQARGFENSYADHAKSVPPAASGIGQETATGTADASYADRGSQADTPNAESEQANELIVAEQAAPTKKAYGTSLPDVSQYIEYRSGKYLVAGNKFWSREEAEKYARDNLLTPVGRLST